MATIVHAVLSYIILTLVVRVFTRRPGAQMTLFEFVIVFLIGGVIILSTVGNDKSMTNCCCAILAVGGMHCFVSRMKTRHPGFGIWLDGTPLVVVRKGEWQESVMRGMNLDPEDVLASARLNGVSGFDQIDYAILERNGGITIMKKERRAGWLTDTANGTEQADATALFTRLFTVRSFVLRCCSEWLCSARQRETRTQSYKRP